MADDIDIVYDSQSENESDHSDIEPPLVFRPPHGSPTTSAGYRERFAPSVTFRSCVRVFEEAKELRVKTTLADWERVFTAHPAKCRVEVKLLEITEEKFEGNREMEDWEQTVPRIETKLIARETFLSAKKFIYGLGEEGPFKQRFRWRDEAVDPHFGVKFKPGRNSYILYLWNDRLDAPLPPGVWTPVTHLEFHVDFTLVDPPSERSELMIFRTVAFLFITNMCNLPEYEDQKHLIDDFRLKAVPETSPRTGGMRRPGMNFANCCFCWFDFTGQRTDRFDLGCGHRIHWGCIGNLDSNFCPVCGLEFPEEIYELASEWNILDADIIDHIQNMNV